MRHIKIINAFDIDLKMLHLDTPEMFLPMMLVIVTKPSVI